MTKTTRRWFVTGLSALALAGFAMTGCGGGGQADISVPSGNRFEPASYPGDWTGDWNNTTFGSTGSAKITFTNDGAASKLTIRHELGGNILGLGAATPETFEGTYTATGITMTGSSTRFGEMTLTIDNEGRITGQGVNVPNPTIDRVDFTGVITPTRIDINYTVTFAVGPAAKGTASVVKQP